MSQRNEQRLGEFSALARTLKETCDASSTSFCLLPSLRSSFLFLSQLGTLLQSKSISSPAPLPPPHPSPHRLSPAKCSQSWSVTPSSFSSYPFKACSSPSHHPLSQ